MTDPATLVIRGGTVVDGSGGEMFEADVAIADGRITEIGKVAANGAEEIDAKGRLVMPGFVDVHTHYDAQILWDPYCTIGGWHGVTSVVLGNCGFGFAPIPPELRDRAMLSMTRNEAIPFETMREGME